MAKTMPWRWNSTTLRDARGTEIAWVRDGVLTIAGPLSGDSAHPDMRFDVETSLDGTTASPRFFLRARPDTSRGGDSGAEKNFEVSQAGLTVTRLRATCGSAHYLMERSAIFGKQRRILALGEKANGAPGIEVARLSPQGGGLEVSAADAEGHSFPDVDAVVLSYSCLLVDAAPRIVRG